MQKLKIHRFFNIRNYKKLSMKWSPDGTLFKASESFLNKEIDGVD